MVTRHRISFHFSVYEPSSPRDAMAGGGLAQLVRVESDVDLGGGDLLHQTSIGVAVHQPDDPQDARKGAMLAVMRASNDMLSPRVREDVVLAARAAIARAIQKHGPDGLLTGRAHLAVWS